MLIHVSFISPPNGSEPHLASNQQSVECHSESYRYTLMAFLAERSSAHDGGEGVVPARGPVVMTVAMK